MTTPTPPPGMKILTDYTQVLPKKAKVWVQAVSKWLRSGQIGGLPSRVDIYAIPLNTTDPQRHAIIAANERMLCNLTEAIAKELGLDIEKIEPPDILHAVIALKARAIPIETKEAPLPAPGGESELKPRYFVVAHDPETYRTQETDDLVDAFIRLQWFDHRDADKEEVRQFTEYVNSDNNWHFSNETGERIYLKWELEDGAIEFYRITHK